MFQRLTGKLSEKVRPTTVQFDNAIYSSIPEEIPPHTSTSVGVRFSIDSHDTSEEDVKSNDGNIVKDGDDNEIDLQYLEDIVNAIVELEEVKESNELDITTLNRNRIGDVKRWRDGPAPIGDISNSEGIKIASLEGNMEQADSDVLTYLNKQDVSEHDRNYEATAALVNYFAELSNNKIHVPIDYEFLEQILHSANINARDKHGQTIMHEVAREWNLDIAVYLKTRGMNIDLPDQWGRTPLFVAVSENYTEMVKWLINNGANINHPTIMDERRKPLHFAAKHDSVESFDILVAHGADPNEMDGFGETPLFIAAHYARVRIFHHMLDIGLPVATANSEGIMCIELIISNLPTETAWRALDQHMVVDNLNRNEKFYMNWLGKNGALNKTNKSARQFSPPDVLEIIVEQADLKLITHPVIQQLIRLKSKVFAYKHRMINVALYLMFTILWSASISVLEVNTHGFTYHMALILALGVLAQILTFHFIYKMYSEYQSYLKQTENEKKRCKRNMKTRERYLHPRWISERALFMKDAETIKRKSPVYWSSGWNILEAICLTMATIQFIFTIVWIARPFSYDITEVRLYFSAVFIVVVWLRLNNCFHSNQYVGGLVAMLGECVIAVARFGFLFCEFFVPFVCAFWVLFGGERKILKHIETDAEYITFRNLMYQMYLLTIVGDYDYFDLEMIDKISAQILVGLYFVLVSLITLNLFIALMSEAISRVNQIASATAYYKEAQEITMLEKYFPNYKKKFENYMEEEGNPLVVKYDRLVNEAGENEQLEKVLMTTRQMAEEMQSTVKGFREMLKCMDIFISSVNNFNTKYPDKKQEEYVAAFAKSASFYTKFMSKMQNKPLYKVAGIVENKMEKLDQLFDKKSIKGN